MKMSKKLKRYFRRSSESASVFDEVSLHARCALKVSDALGGQCTAMDVVALSDVATPIATLAEAEDFAVTPPTRPGETGSSSRGRIGERRAWLVEDRQAVGFSSAWVGEGNVAIPDYYARRSDKVISDGQLLLWHGNDRKAIVFRSKAPEVRESGISLFGTGTFNWYHWLIEQLPAAYLAENLGEEYESFPLVIPENIETLPSFRDSLALFSGRRRVETIGSTPCNFRRLIVVDPVIEEPFNMVDGQWPDPRDYAFAPETMRAYREAILDRLGTDRRTAQRRIYLARKHGRRAYNQEAALKIAERYECEPVYPEEMSFAEQVQMMHDAAVVVGPSGAAFANTLFCQPETQLLSWLVPEYGGFCSYTNLAQITGSRIRYIFPPANDPVSSTREAFSATYEMDLDIFEAALEAAVSAAGVRSS